MLERVRGAKPRPNLNPMLSQPVKPSEKRASDIPIDLSDSVSLQTSRSLAKPTDLESSRRANTVDELLDTPAYKNISDEEAAKMLGYFSKVMRSKGFPWEYKAKVNGKLKDISDLEVLYRLKRGEPVYFFPKRNVELSLSGGDIEKVGKLFNSKPVQNLGNKVKAAESIAKPEDKIGREISDGEPIVIRSYGELKLLYQLFNPDAKVDESDPVGKATKSLSKFVVEKFSSKYPWRFYSTDKPPIKTRVMNFLKSVSGKMVVGGLMALAFAGPIGLLLSLFGSQLVATSTVAQAIGAISAMGAGLGALFGAKDGLREAKLGEDIGPLEALKRIMRGEGVKFQQKRVRSMTFPVIGKVVWQTNYREPIEVRSPRELELLKAIYYSS